MDLKIYPFNFKGNQILNTDFKANQTHLSHLKKLSQDTFVSFGSRSVEKAEYNENIGFRVKNLLPQAITLVDKQAQEVSEIISGYKNDYAQSHFGKIDEITQPIIKINTKAYNKEFSFTRTPKDNKSSYSLDVVGYDGKVNTIFIDDKNLKSKFNTEKEGTSLNELVEIGLTNILNDAERKLDYEKINKDTNLKLEQLKSKIQSEYIKAQESYNNLNKKVEIQEKIIEDVFEEIGRIQRQVDSDSKTVREHDKDIYQTQSNNRKLNEELKDSVRYLNQLILLD